MNRQQQIDRFLLEAHRFALRRLKETPSRIETVRSQLARWRGRAGPTRSDAYWDEWQRLLDGDLDELERAVCAENDRAAALRNVSPLSSLLTAAERAMLLRAARSA